MFSLTAAAGMRHNHRYVWKITSASSTPIQHRKRSRRWRSSITATEKIQSQYGKFWDSSYIKFTQLWVIFIVSCQLFNLFVWNCHKCPLRFPTVFKIALCTRPTIVIRAKISSNSKVGKSHHVSHIFCVVWGELTCKITSLCFTSFRFVWKTTIEMERWRI